MELLIQQHLCCVLTLDWRKDEGKLTNCLSFNLPDMSKWTTLLKY